MSAIAAYPNLCILPFFAIKPFSKANFYVSVVHSDGKHLI